MMRISDDKKMARSIFCALLTMLFANMVAKAQVGVTVVTSVNGDVVTAEALMYNFDSIRSQQYTLSWDPSELEFMSVGDFNLPGLMAANFGINQVSSGYLTNSWLDPSLSESGVSLPDCATVYKMYFHILNDTVPPIQLSNFPTPIEIFNSSNQQLTLTQNLGCSDLGQISGHVFHDLDNDCLQDGNENGLQNWKLKFENNGNTFYITSTDNGFYNIFLPSGLYDVSLVLPDNYLWGSCQQTQTIAVSAGSLSPANFSAFSFIDCPAMTVDLSTPLLRRCFDSNYFIHYCNNGTVTAEDASVEVTFDSYLEVQFSSIPWSAVNGNTFTFQLGDVDVNECGDFYVEVLVNCDAVLGQTHCSEAHIFPDPMCIPTNPSWDGSDLEITASCDGDSVRFQIINTGDDMADPVEFIVVEDDMVYLQGETIQLAQFETAEITMAANGSTWRLEATESAYNPLSSFAVAVIEGCGTNGDGTFSLGFVNQFPINDEGPASDEDCRENVGSYDPNDKMAFPEGFCESHFIKPDTEVEYFIRFQNTGTDTAFTVVVTDTLSSLLDPASVVPGASSHAYDFDLLGNGVVQFTFENIMLPDSNVNEAASHGFLQFKVSQTGGNQPGDLILNKAAIVFDFNDPVFTNEYHHTVGDDFLAGSAQNGNLSISGHVKTWYGEPLENVEMRLTDICPVYTDENGNFEFNNLDTGNYTLAGALVNSNIYEGTTVLDLVKLYHRIFALSPLNGYQSVAADINRSNSITVFDMVMLRDLILRRPVDILPVWTIVTTDASLSGVYNYNPLNSNLENQDFFGIKGGNIIEESMVELSNINPVFSFESYQTSMDTVVVKVNVSNADSLVAYQWGLKWNPSILKFLDMQQALPSPSGGPLFHSPEPGKLSAMQYPAEQFPNDTTICTLRFLVLAGVGSNTLLELDETNLPFQVVVEECKLASASVQSTTITIQNPSATSSFEKEDFNLKILPNPSLAGRPFSVEVKSEMGRDLAFAIYNQQGRLMWENQEHFQAGASVARFSPNLPQGIYLLRISDDQGQSTVMKLSVL